MINFYFSDTDLFEKDIDRDTNDEEEEEED